MRFSEVFLLAAGVLGFVIDAVALAALLGHGDSPAAVGAFEVNYTAWAAIALVYGWILVASVLVRRRLQVARNRGKTVLRGFRNGDDLVAVAVISTGAVLLPIGYLLALHWKGGAHGPVSTSDFIDLILLAMITFLTMGAVGFFVYLAVHGLTSLTSPAPRRRVS